MEDFLSGNPQPPQQDFDFNVPVGDAVASTGNFLIPKGKYLMKVVDYFGKTKDDGTRQAVWEYKGLEGAATGKTVKDFVGLTEKAREVLLSRAQAYDVVPKDGKLNLTPDKVIGKIVVVNLDHNTWEGRTFNKVKFIDKPRDADLARLQVKTDNIPF
jgi:hypothetical protein